MRVRVGSLAILLYPFAFRRRYGEEMRALIEDHPPGPLAIFNLLCGALRAHLRPPPGLAVNLDPNVSLRLGLGGVLTCWVAFSAAGFGFYNTTEDEPFSSAGGVHPLLGGDHVAIQVLAVIGSVGLLAGALPLVMLALRQARHGSVRLKALTSAPLVAVLTFGMLTGLLVTLAHSAGVHAGTGVHTAGIVWLLAGLTCGGVCVLAAREVLMMIDVGRRLLLGSLVFATLVTGAMFMITAAVAIYAITLSIDAPILSGELNGPLQFPTVGASVVIQVMVMVICSALAIGSARRTWKAVIA